MPTPKIADDPIAHVKSLRDAPFRLFVDLRDGDDFSIAHDSEKDAISDAVRFIEQGYVVRSTSEDVVEHPTDTAIYYPLSNVLSLKVGPKP